MTSQPPPPDGQMRSELREARQRFVTTFDRRVHELQALAATSADEEARGDLARAAHRLVGAAGLVGFPGVSEAARALEQAAAAGESAATLVRATEALARAYAQDAEVPPDWAPNDDPTRPPPLTIVLAEDDELQQRTLTRHLEGAGHAVTAVSRGDEVLATVRRTRPSILVLDVQLPGVDGYTVCRQLKADPTLASVGVVFLTAAISTDDRLAGFLLGADDYIEKPVDLAEVSLRLSTVAARRAEAARRPPRLAPAELTYAAFVARTSELVASVPGTLVLLRMPADMGLRVAMWLTGELRRDDVLGRYRDDLRILFLPGLVGRTAARHVSDIVGRLGASGLPVSSGLASIERPGERTLAALLQDADASLAASAAQAIEAPREGPGADGTTAAAAAPTPTITLRRRSVVVADDDEGTRLMAVRPLMRAGIHFRMASDGREALELVGVETPEVLVLDLEMPHVDGLGVLEALARRSGPRPRVIVVSASRGEAVVQRALGLGADDYVVKPFNPLMLLARIRRLMH